jgi:hypothetical protein
MTYQILLPWVYSSLDLLGLEQNHQVLTNVKRDCNNWIFLLLPSLFVHRWASQTKSHHHHHDHQENQNYLSRSLPCLLCCCVHAYLPSNFKLMYRYLTMSSAHVDWVGCNDQICPWLLPRRRRGVCLMLGKEGWDNLLGVKALCWLCQFKRLVAYKFPKLLSSSSLSLTSLFFRSIQIVDFDSYSGVSVSSRLGWRFLQVCKGNSTPKVLEWIRQWLIAVVGT